MIRRPRAAALVLLVALLAACGTGTRDKALRGALTAVDAAAEGFVAFDDAEQQAIVARATTREQAQAELAAYRERRRPVIAALAAAYQAIAVAALRRGTPLPVAAAAVTALIESIATLKNGASP